MTAIDLFARNTGYNVSTKYAAINTANIMAAFEAAGFVLQRVSKANVRNKANDGVQKHLLIFRHPDFVLRGVGDVVPEIILQNSYDGSCAFKLTLGIFRMVCANGMITGSSFESARIVHIGRNVAQTAINGAFEIAAQMDVLQRRIAAMQSVQLTETQQRQFALEACNLLLPSTAVMPDLQSLLEVRRAGDVGNDLWTVFNRVQEAVIRGGARYTIVTKHGTTRRASSRAVKSIDRNVGLNKALWTVAESFLQLNAA